MADSGSIRALVVDAGDVIANVCDLESLNSARSTQVPGLSSLADPGANWEPLIQTYVSSRRGWLVFMVGRLVDTIPAHELRFMTPEGLPEQRWRFDAMEADEDPEMSLPVHGHLFEGQSLDIVLHAITAVFAWSRANIPFLKVDLDMGYFANEAEILEAIDKPLASLQLNRDNRVNYAEDGEGPAFLFCFLHSLRCVFETARASKLAVLVDTGLLPTYRVAEAEED